MSSIQEEIGYNDAVGVIIAACNAYITGGDVQRAASPHSYVRDHMREFLNSLKTEYEAITAIDAILFYHNAIPESSSNGTSSITFARNNITYNIIINRFHIRVFGDTLRMLENPSVQHMCTLIETDFLHRFTDAKFIAPDMTQRINADIQKFIDILETEDSISDVAALMGRLWGDLAQSLFNQIVLASRHAIVGYLMKNDAKIIMSSDVAIYCWIGGLYYEFSLTKKTIAIRTIGIERMYHHEYHYFLNGIMSSISAGFRRSIMM